jgi:hypothetical protein
MSSPFDRPRSKRGDNNRRKALASLISFVSDDEQGQAGGKPLLTDVGREFVQELIDRIRAGGDGPLTAADIMIRPQWDEDEGCLSLGRYLLKKYRKKSSAQVKLLTAFESAHWPMEPIANPLQPELGDTPDDLRDRLHNTVKNLNKELPARTIRFWVEGDQVGWRYSPPPNQKR